MDEELYQRIQADIERERTAIGWLRSRSLRVRVALIISVSLASLATTLALHGLRPELSPLWALSAALLGVVATFAVTVALRPMHRPSLSAGTRWGLVAASIGAALLAITVVSNGTFGALGSLACLGWGALAGAPVFTAVLLVDRRPHRGAVFAGLAGGSVAALVAQSSCGAEGLTHLLVEHFGLALAFVAVAWLGRAALERATSMA